MTDAALAAKLRAAISGKHEGSFVEEVTNGDIDALLRMLDAREARVEQLERVLVTILDDEVDGREDIDGNGHANPYMRIGTLARAALDEGQP